MINSLFDATQSHSLDMAHPGPAFNVIYILSIFCPFHLRHGEGGGEPDHGEQRAAGHQERPQHCQGRPHRKGRRTHRVRKEWTGQISSSKEISMFCEVNWLKKQIKTTKYGHIWMVSWY